MKQSEIKIERLSIGNTVDGKFRILSVLGEGGLGTVYEAEQAELNRNVAIKILQSSTLGDAENRARFEREAQLLAALEHANIVKAYSFGSLPSGHPYMVMELVTGKTLSRALADDKNMHWQRVVKIGRQICQGMEAAHKAGVVHRDLKPQNLMLVDKPAVDTVKILDFGLSRILPHAAHEMQQLTQTGALIGSIHYMSPEVCLGLKADQRSDIYSLGCILYECLAGKVPLDCDNPVGMLHKHKQELPAPLRSTPAAAEIPAELELAVFKALQKAPENRYQSMSEMENMLKLIEEGRHQEVTLQDVKLGDGKQSSATRRQNSTIWLTAAAFAVISAAGLMMGTLRQYIDHNQLLPGIFEKKGGVGADGSRTPEIERAKQMVTMSDRLLKTGDKHQAETFAKQALHSLGRFYPSTTRDKEGALEDLLLMEKLSVIYGKLRIEEHQRVMQFLDNVHTNDAAFLTPDQHSSLLLAMARISAANGEYPYAAIKYEEAIRELVQQNQTSTARRALEEAKTSTTRAKGDLDSIEFYKDVSEANVLKAENKLNEAKQVAQKALQFFPRAFPPEYKGRFPALVELFSMQQNLGDLDSAHKTMLEAEQSAGNMLNGSIKSDAVRLTHTSSSGSVNEAISRMETLVARAQTAELKQHAQATLDKIRQSDK